MEMEKESKWQNANLRTRQRDDGIRGCVEMMSVPLSLFSEGTLQNREPFRSERASGYGVKKGQVNTAPRQKDKQGSGSGKQDRHGTLRTRPLFLTPVTHP